MRLQGGLLQPAPSLTRTIPERTSDLKMEPARAKNTKVGKAQMLDDKLVETPIDQLTYPLSDRRRGGAP